MPFPKQPTRCQPGRSILPHPLNSTGAGTRASPTAPGRPGLPGSALPCRSAPRQHPGLMHHSLLRVPFCYWRQWVLTGERKPEARPADPQAGLSSRATAKQQIQSPSGEGSVVNIWQRAWTQWFKNLPEVGLRHPLFFFSFFSEAIWCLLLLLRAPGSDVSIPIEKLTSLSPAFLPSTEEPSPQGFWGSFHPFQP